MERLRADAPRLTMQEATERLLAANLVFGMVTPIASMHEDPQAVASKLFQVSQHPTAGRLREPRPPIRFGAAPSPVPGSSPGFGEHTAQLLTEIGYPDVADLRARGVVA
jgi:formyl-CoA transferase